MDALIIRSAISSDIHRLVRLEHHYSTDHVWQMGYQASPGEIAVSFREVRLPRPMRVEYPRDPSRLPEDWNRKLLVQLAEWSDNPIGYACLVEGPAARSIWVTDLVVELRHRRQGVATRLLSSIRDWARPRGYDRLFLEMQTKNHAAVSLARKLGLSFAGYSDRYYLDQDIALFYAWDLT